MLLLCVHPDAKSTSISSVTSGSMAPAGVGTLATATPNDNAVCNQLLCHPEDPFKHLHRNPAAAPDRLRLFICLLLAALIQKSRVKILHDVGLSKRLAHRTDGFRHEIWSMLKEPNRGREVK
eukprot:scaffold227862_cov36-Prasinocladus_malaysianus.AAC.1